MNKNIFILIAFSLLVFPALSSAQFGLQEKTEQVKDKQEKIEQKVRESKEKIAERIRERQVKIEQAEKVNGKATVRAEALEAKAKELQTRSEERAKRLEERKEAEKKNFCSNIAGRISERQFEFAERQSEFIEKKSALASERKTERAEEDAKLEEKRVAAAERRAKMYQNLLSSAETDAQKAAVADFQNTVERAVADREKAIDAARIAFRNGIDDVKSSRKADGTEALATFKTAMQAALTQAKADCTKGDDQTEVRNEYQNALEQAKKNLIESRKNNGIGDVVSELAKTRSTAVKTALSSYRATLEQAFKTLKESFGEDLPSEAPSEPGA